MRTLGISIVFCIAACIAVGCASENREVHLQVADPEDISALDSLSLELLEEIYLERYSAIAFELNQREKSGNPSTELVEARAFVDASEEMYLFGKTNYALRLLEKAAELLGLQEQ